MRLLASVCCLTAVSVALGAGTAWAAAPEAPSAEALSHTDTSVFLHGVLSPGGPGQEGTYEFLYAASPSTCSGEGKAPRGLSFGFELEEVNQEIFGLTPETTYTVCLLDRNLAGEETLSAPETFKTSFEPEAPETQAAGSIAASAAILHGVLGPNATSGHGEAEAGYYEFVYRRSTSECEGEGGESTGPLSSTPVNGKSEPLQGEPKEAVETEVTGLSPGTQYTACLRAWNTTGQSATGAPVTFTTLATKPSVSDETSASISTRSARVSAQIDTGGVAASYFVEYGTGSSYGSQTESVSLSPGTSTATVELTGLQPSTEYHYRFVATNGPDGSEAGADVSFTTYGEGTGGVLPDDRVYEMVTPLENHNAEVYEPGYELIGSQRPFMAGRDGDRVAYIAEPSVGGNAASGDDLGDEYVAVRGSQGGWTQQNVTPLGSANNVEYQAFSEDVSVGYVSSSTVPPFIASEAPKSPVGAESSESAPVLYSRHFDEPDFFPLFSTMPLRLKKGLYFTVEFGSQAASMANRGEDGRAIYAGASSDSSHVLFEANDDFLQGKGQLEEELHKNVHGEIESGERIAGLWSEGRGEEAEALERVDTRDELYMSVNGVLSLVNVLPDGSLLPGASFPESDDHVISTDGSHVYWVAGNFGSPGIVYLRIDGSRTVQVSAGAAKFWAASGDGRYAFYIESGVLWRYDAATEQRAQITGAGGVEAVVGINESGEDGAYVYFVSTEAIPDADNPAGQQPVDGQANLYVREPAPDGADQSRIEFIGTLSQEDGKAYNYAGRETGQPGFDWAEALGGRTAKVTPDGHAITFVAKENLTGRPYPHEGAAEEVYVYDTRGGSLICASCRPQASEGLFSESLQLTHTYRWISEDGNHVFFDSFEPLVAQDTNGNRDVYEWERDGSGACREADGCVYLLSNGTSEGPARLVDASASGDDVFFETSQRLAETDLNENRDLYDARVDGQPPVQPPGCTGTGCQGVPAPAPPFATPASVTFNGVGNFPAPVIGATGKTTKKAVTTPPARRLTRALRECRKRYAHRARAKTRCEASARKRYQTKKAKRSTTSGRVK